MQMVNRTQARDLNQWIESFVEQALENADIACDQVVIEVYEEEKSILLNADGQTYRIQLLAFLPIAADMNGMVCTENVQYILYRQQEGEKAHGEEVDDDFIRVQRGNHAAYEEPTEKTLF